MSILQKVSDKFRNDGLEVSVEILERYLQSNHWKMSEDCGADPDNVIDVFQCMFDFLENGLEPISIEKGFLHDEK